MPSVEEATAEIIRRAQARRERPEPGPSWAETSREEQRRPENCETFVLVGGRGSGKTRAGAEDFLERMRSGDTPILHMLAPTRDDVKKVMIEGLSGILACAKPGEIQLPEAYNKSELQITFKNGVVARGFSGEQPDRLNGPQCGHLWADEFWAIPPEAIHQAELGCRIGRRVTRTFTSTPKGTPSTKAILSRKEALIRRMRTRDNYANLSPGWVDQIEEKYRNTRLGRTELEGEFLEDVEGALWEPLWFEREGFRAPVYRPENPRPLDIVKIVVAVDPSITDPGLKKNPHKEPDECGIMVVGLTSDACGVTLADLSGVYKPETWARLVVKAYSLFRANSIVVEVNQGGQLVKDAIRGYGPNCVIQMVHASMNKRARAEPVAMLYEQGRWQHAGVFPALESEQTSWDARQANSPSPNRIDSLVWGAHGLGLCVATGMRVQSRITRAS